MKIIELMLDKYNESSHIIRLKARFLLYVCIALIFFMVLIIAYTTYLQTGNPSFGYSVDMRLLGFSAGLLLLIIGCTAALVRGRFSFAAHTIIIALFATICAAMAVDRSEVVSRLDTIVLVLAVLSATPLFITRSRIAVLLYFGANLAALYFFMFYFRRDLDLSASVFPAFLADNTVAFLFSGFVSYTIFSITTQVLKQMDRGNRSLEQTNMELQATLEELEASNEEFEAQNEEILRSQEELRQSESFIRRIVEGSPAVINRYSLVKGRFEFVSPRVREMGGYSPEEFYNDPEILKRFVHPDWFDRAMKWWTGLIKGTSPPSLEYQIRRSDGSIRWVREHSHLIRNESGKPVAIEGIILDITDIKEWEAKLRENEDKYRGLVENITEIIYTVDQYGNFTYVSPSSERMSGYAPDELIGTDSFSYIHPDDLGPVQKESLELRQGSVKPSEYRVRKKNGDYIWVMTTSRPVMHNGQYIGATGVLTNIHERKTAEATLVESEKRFRTLIESSPLPILLARGGTLLYTNNAFRQLARIGSDDEIIGTSLLDYIAPEERSRVAGFIKKRESDGDAPSVYESVGLRTDGTRFPYEINIARVSVAEGPVTLAFVRDITEVKLAEKSLREAGLRTVRQRAALAALSNDPVLFSGDIVESLKKISEAASEAENTGRLGIWLLSEDGAELHCVELYEAGDRSHTAGAMLRAGDFPKYFESMKQHSRIRADDARAHPDTSEFRDSYLVPHGITSMLDAGIYIEGKLSGVVCFEHVGEKRDWHADDESFASTIASIISQVFINAERMRAEAAIRESEEKYRGLVENIHDIIFTVDREGRITYLSPSVKRYEDFSIADIIGSPMVNFIHPEDREKLIRRFAALAGGSPVPTEYRIVFPSGMFRWARVSTRPVFRNGSFAGASGVISDVHERKLAEEENERIQKQLVQAQKMEAVGTLAGGIAHDFNNMLGGIMGSLNLMELILEKEKPAHRESLMQFIETAMVSAQRAADTTKQLLALSRKSELMLAPVDVTHSLKHVLKLCRNSFPKSVELDFRIGSAPLRIQADPVQIEQVLLNLCVNASHSMTIMRAEGERQGGVLTVVPGEVTCDGSLCAQHPEARPGTSYVRITVSDTGVGMDEETRRQIFDPFFTTKKQDEGTGLGLAMVYGIVKQHDGFIHVYSEPGKGSAFSIYIPARGEIPPDRRSAQPRQVIAAGTGTVLVIDDEKSMLQISKGMLEQCGYTILTAQSGNEGVEIFRKEHAAIDGVLLDLSMPGMSGLEVFARMKEIDPGVPVLIASGLMEGNDLKKAMDLGVRGFLQKPYTIEELSAKMKEALAR